MEASVRAAGIRSAGLEEIRVLKRSSREERIRR